MSQFPPASHAVSTILIVDDTPANVQVLSGMLKEHGYKTRVALSGEFALQAVQNNPPDLILLDINMPEMDGYTVCQHLKADEQLREIPVIFISALTETMDKVKAFDVGGVDYVTKPFQFAEVEARVVTHLKLRRYQLYLEQMVTEQVQEISAAQMNTILALSKLAESAMTTPENTWNACKRFVRCWRQLYVRPRRMRVRSMKRLSTTWCMPAHCTMSARWGFLMQSC